MTDPSIDLLGPKRVELGLSRQSSSFESASRLLLKGMLLAFLLLSMGGIGSVYLLWRERQLQQVVIELTPDAREADQLDGQVRSIRADTKSVKQNILLITNRLVSTRSGSAFMEQLKRVTPSSIQLLDVSVGSNQVQIKGVVPQQPLKVGPLEQINAFLLNLERLSGVPKESARLEKITRSDEELVQFDLTLDFDQLYQLTAEELLELGATGLARRHQWLQDQGLPL